MPSSPWSYFKHLKTLARARILQILLELPWGHGVGWEIQGDKDLAKVGFCGKPMRRIDTWKRESKIERISRRIDLLAIAT
jgi:hypothetical protein